MGVSWREELGERQSRLSMVARYQANNPQQGLPDGPEPNRKQVVNAFFQKKKKFPTTAQLRLWRGFA